MSPQRGQELRPPIALTMGEPAGIGGEIALRAWIDRESGVPPFVLIDDAIRLAKLAASIGLGIPIQQVTGMDEGAAAFARALPVLHRPLPVTSLPGRPDPANAPAVISAIEVAVGLVHRGEAAAVVTNPIHKNVLHQGGFPFPGHTEFLAALAGNLTPPVMLLACPLLKVVPVTIHLSLKQAIDILSTSAIVQTGRTLAAALALDFGIAQPRIAVAGLNPHAGEQGDMGDEDAAIVAPAIAELRAHGIDAFGPLPPDTLFAPRARSTYDAALCMYHDQALIPIKTLDFDGGVNVTLGLPFVRTSPDHGTAFNIAGTGTASASSLVAALRMAGEIAARRAPAGG